MTHAGAVARIGAFIVVMALTVFGLGQALEPVALHIDPNFAKVNAQMQLRGEHFRVIVLGNSVTQNSYNPGEVDPILGASSYNLASGGQSFLASELQYLHYVAANERPRLVVFGLFLNREQEEIGMAPEAWLWLSNELKARYRREVVAQGGAPVHWSQGMLLAVKAYRYRRVMPEIPKYMLMGDARIGRNVRGHTSLGMVMPAFKTAAIPHRAALNEEGLRSALATLRGQGVPVLLFEPPNHPEFHALTEGRADSVRVVEDLVASDPGLAFVSFVDTPVGDDEWLGPNHLNTAGADRFSRDTLGPEVARWLARVDGDRFVDR